MQLYAPLVVHWCRRSGLKSDDVDDVVQDIFVSVSKQLDRFRTDQPQATFRGWLRVITQRRIADHFRHIAHAPQAVGGTTAARRLHDVPEPLADDPDAESEETGIVQRAIELIRSDFQAKTWTAFKRTAMENAAPHDVARELGMTAAAVQMAKARVLRRLREELAGLVQ